MFSHLISRACNRQFLFRKARTKDKLVELVRKAAEFSGIDLEAAAMKRVGGRGGMDFIMDARWIYCLQQGLPLDMDVYDLAATSCLCELTEKSADRRGRTMAIPDFTRGAWRTNPPLGIVDIDLGKFDIICGRVNRSKEMKWAG